MTDTDREMINAMALIKKYCKDVDGCSICPMFDNCHSGSSKERFPYFWTIPEV